MIRVTNNLLSNNMLNNVNRHNNLIESLQRHIADGNRIHNPHEDPAGTITSMIYRSNITEYERYTRNIEDGIDRLSYVDAKLQEVKSYLDNIRERAVAGANGVYTEDDLQIMGMEVEQFLHQIILVGNSKFRGETVFSGYDTEIQPFEVSTQRNPGFQQPVVTSVQYEGDLGVMYREIDRGEYLEINVPGNRVFWATNQTIRSQSPGTGYVANEDQYIRIDGKEIKISQGDNLETIVEKINMAGLSVKAEIDNTNGNNFLVLETTRPHQLWLEDDRGGTVFQDLGILAHGGAYPPNNYAPSAQISGESMFDSIIELRDALLNGDVNKVNQGIGAMDQSINNLMEHLAEVGARQQRMETVNERVAQSKFYSQEAYSKIQGLDMSEAITNLRFTEFAHQTALQIGARIIPDTLLNYLR